MEHISRVVVACAALASLLTACGESGPPQAAVELCDRAPAARARVDAIADGVNRTDGLDATQQALQALYTATEPMQVVSDLPSESRWSILRMHGRAVLSTGTLRDGSSPINGAELAASLARDMAAWDHLARACAEDVQEFS